MPAASLLALDGNDIWEALFGIMKGDVPDEMTEDVCGQLATALAAQEQTLQADLVALLRKCREQFAFYHENHRQKQTEDGDKKAAANLAFVHEIDAALAQAEGRG